MINNFNYSYPTEIVFGQQSINQLPLLLKKYSAQKILFVFGENSLKKNGIYEIILKEFKKVKITYVEYGGCEPNPDSLFVNKGAKLALKEKINFILAVGGGSVIDASKAMALLMKNDNSEGIWPYMLSQKKFINNALPIGVVLTSFGTGSEGNGSFIISNKKTLEKQGKSHLSVRPIFAICDPTYSLSLSHWQTACGCVDIVSHLLEQYFCEEEGENLSDSLIVGALKNVIYHSKNAIADPNNFNSRSNLMLASSFALSYVLSLGKTLDWSVHKIEHALSGVYDVAHGAGLACIFPAWLKLASINPKISNKIIKLGSELELINNSNSESKKIPVTISYLENFFIGLGLPIKLSKLLKTSPDINKIAKIASIQVIIGKIFEINDKKCQEILKMAS